MNNNELVRDYLENISDNLFNSSGVRLPQSVINSIVTKYEGSDLDVDDLIENVNEDVQAYIDEVVEKDNMYDLDKEPENKEKQEDSEKLDEQEEPVKLDEMDTKTELEKKNVVLNNTDLNLIAIAKASTPEELQAAMNNCPYLNKRLVNSKLDGVEFEKTKRNVFEMYRDSIPEELRDIGGLGLSTMDDYIAFSNSLHDEYDTVTMDDGSEYGKSYDLKKDENVSLEEMRTSDTKEIEAGTNTTSLKREDPNLVDTEGNLEQKHRIDINNENNKDESALNRSGNVLLGTAVAIGMVEGATEKQKETSEELSQMLKSPEVKNDTKLKDLNNKPKVLKLNNNDNNKDSSTYKQAGMAMSDSLLLIIFMIVFIIFIGVVYFFTR